MSRRAGIQLLHCIAHDADAGGGESLLIDGFAAAEQVSGQGSDWEHCLLITIHWIPYPMLITIHQIPYPMFCAPNPFSQVPNPMFCAPNPLSRVPIPYSVF